MEREKYCPRCQKKFPATQEYFYLARSTKTRKKEAWQSYCKICWRDINREYRERRKVSIQITYIDMCFVRRNEDRPIEVVS